jgi:hypothetical protein
VEAIVSLETVPSAAKLVQPQSRSPQRNKRQQKHRRLIPVLLSTNTKSPYTTEEHYTKAKKTYALSARCLKSPGSTAPRNIEPGSTQEIFKLPEQS